MNVFERREQIIECMKMRKFDTAYNLGFEFGVSERTIRNDIQELSVSGYPIQTDVGHGGGIRWTGNKRQFSFTEREKLALHNALEVVSPEDKLVLEILLNEKNKPEVEIGNNDLFEFLADGKSQRALAVELGISGTLLSFVLSGRRKPSAELCKRISKYKKEVLSTV